MDQKKINVLFEISENKDENEEIISITDSSIDNVKEKKAKKKEVIERNLRERKKTMIINPINSNIGYKSKLRAKKTTLRLKKLGNTFSDFIIWYNFVVVSNCKYYETFKFLISQRLNI